MAPPPAPPLPPGTGSSRSFDRPVATVDTVPDYTCQGALAVKSLPVRETQVRSLGREDALEKGMAAPSSTLAWRVLWTEETRGLQSMGSQRVGHG